MLIYSRTHKVAGVRVTATISVTLQVNGDTNRKTTLFQDNNILPVQFQLQMELQVVQSRLRSDAACVGGHTFESYAYTLKWVTANCSAEDWQYVMDMPALYSLVSPDGQEYDVLLQEQSHSSRAAFASSTQAHLDLSFKTRVQESLERIKVLKMGILLQPLILTISGF
jgi:hypothetical protein